MFFSTFFIYFWDRERQSMNGGGAERERETQNLKQASGSALSAQNPTRSSNPQTMRSWPEPSQMLNRLSHPGAPFPATTLMQTEYKLLVPSSRWGNQSLVLCRLLVPGPLEHKAILSEEALEWYSSSFVPEVLHREITEPSLPQFLYL